MMVEVTNEEAVAAELIEAAADECEVEEIITMEEDDSYLELLLQSLAVIHSITSLSMLIAYYCLKVQPADCCINPLVLTYYLIYTLTYLSFNLLVNSLLLSLNIPLAYLSFDLPVNSLLLYS